MPHIATEGTGERRPTGRSGRATARGRADRRQPTAATTSASRCGDRVGLLLGGRLDHHADQLLGARRAQQHPPGVAELRLDGVDRLGDLVALDDGEPVAHRHVDQRPAAAAAPRRRARPARRRSRAIRDISASPVSRPSPVVAWSRNTRCPLCSPPRLRSAGAQRLQHVAVADGGGLHRDAGVAHRVVEAEVAHHGGDDGVVRERAALVQRQRADGQDRVAVDDARRRRSRPGSGRRRRRGRCRGRRRAPGRPSIERPEVGGADAVVDVPAVGLAADRVHRGARPGGRPRARPRRRRRARSRRRRAARSAAGRRVPSRWAT